MELCFLYLYFANIVWDCALLMERPCFLVSVEAKRSEIKIQALTED